VGSGKTLLDKLDALLDRPDLKGKIKKGDMFAIKFHFREKGNAALIRPIFLRRVVDQVKRYQRSPSFII
jgi:hypothetical protein